MWPNMLLPNIYHGSQTPYQQYGALKGELAIFLGLLALSMSKDYVLQYLPSTFTNQQWNVHHVPHGCKCDATVAFLKICANSSAKGTIKGVWLCGSTPVIPLGTVALLVKTWEPTKSEGDTIIEFRMSHPVDTKGNQLSTRIPSRRSRYALSAPYSIPLLHARPNTLPKPIHPHTFMTYDHFHTFVPKLNMV
jgi:hypothetical protein